MAYSVINQVIYLFIFDFGSQGPSYSVPKWGEEYDG